MNHGEEYKAVMPLTLITDTMVRVGARRKGKDDAECGSDKTHVWQMAEYISNGRVLKNRGSVSSHLYLAEAGVNAMRSLSDFNRST